MNESIEEEERVVSPKKKSQPVPASKKIFKGLTFLVTGFKQETSDNEEFLEDLTSTIISFGGKVIDDILWSHSSVINKKRVNGFPGTILIADSPRRTLKYLLALASGTPCVSFEWIFDCIEKKSLIPLESYRLPSGYSKEREETVESFCKEEPFEVTVFKEERIEVVGSSSFKVRNLHV